MNADFWLGFASPFLLVVAGWLVLAVVAWIRWWFIDPEKSFRGGWGYVHEVETFLSADEYGRERWGVVQHPHYWPPDTPRWLGRLLEPMRLRLCVRRPDYRPVTKETR